MKRPRHPVLDPLIESMVKLDQQIEAAFFEDQTDQGLPVDALLAIETLQDDLGDIAAALSKHLNTTAPTESTAP